MSEILINKIFKKHKFEMAVKVKNMFILKQLFF